MIGPHTIVYSKYVTEYKLTVESAIRSDRGGSSQPATLEAHTIMQS